MRLGLQMYTLRNLEESFLETIERVGELPYEGVQIRMPDDATPDEVRAALDDAGLSLAGAHTGLDALESEPNFLKPYRDVGCTGFVIPYYPSEAFETIEGAREAGQRLVELSDDLLESDEHLHYHNHTEEFTQFEDRTAFDEFADAATDIGLEIDVGLANYAGVDPVELLDRYGDRVTYLHMTDSIEGEWERRHSDLGTGTVPIPEIIDVSREHDIEWIIFEHGLTDDPIASVEGAADVLTELL